MYICLYHDSGPKLMADSACPICLEDMASVARISNEACQHVVCAVCFFARMRCGSSGADLVDSFSCPLCKAHCYFAAPVLPEKENTVQNDGEGDSRVNKIVEDIAAVHDLRHELWSVCCRSSDTEGGLMSHPPLPAMRGFLPSMLYVCYEQNRRVVASAMRIVCKTARKRMLLSNLEGVGDNRRTRATRAASCAALGVMYESLQKRRKCAHTVLEEARDLVAMLEDGEPSDTEEYLHGAAPDGVLFLVMSFSQALQEGAELRTCMWVHSNWGRAVGELLRVAASPGFGVSLIRCGMLDSSVLAVVAGMPDPAHRVTACLRQLRLGNQTPEMEPAAMALVQLMVGRASA